MTTFDEMKDAIEKLKAASDRDIYEYAQEAYMQGDKILATALRQYVVDRAQLRQAS